MSSQTHPSSSHNDATAQQAEDLFFQNEPGLIKTYTFHREKLIEVKSNDDYVSFQHLCPILCFPPCYPCYFYYCYVNCVVVEENARDKVNATHVALTQDGIKFVVDDHKQGFRMGSEKRVDRTVAYSSIKYADIVSSAPFKRGQKTSFSSANTSFPLPPTTSTPLVHISTVNIETVRSGSNSEKSDSGKSQKSDIKKSKSKKSKSKKPQTNYTIHRDTDRALSIIGLSDPHAFQQDVLAMMNGEGVNGVGKLTPADMAIARGKDFMPGMPVHGMAMDRGSGRGHSGKAAVGGVGGVAGSGKSVGGSGADAAATLLQAQVRGRAARSKKQTPTTKSVMGRMGDLESMSQKGYVTAEEFEAKRKEILASA
jgi:hypothetical protein